MKPTHLSAPIRCGMLDEVLSLIGDKWSIYVVVMLGQGKRRFSELKREVDGISQKMLTVTLRGLERDGYVTRTVYATIPPRVEYELTELGFDLLVPVRALCDWATQNETAVTGARARYDGRTAEAAE